MYLRGGAYEEGVYICEPQDMDEEQGLLLHGTHAIDLAMNSTMPSILNESVSACMRALNTNKNGACGIHALLGKPVRTADGQLELLSVDAREIAVTHLGPSLENLFQRVNISDLVEVIRDFFWDGFVVTHLQERQEEGSESRLFWESLTHLMPDLAQEAAACVSNNTSDDIHYKSVKKKTVHASRKFFHTDIEEAVVRPLAVQLGFIPASVDVFTLTEPERERLAAQPCNNEFLKDREGNQRVSESLGNLSIGKRIIRKSKLMPSQPARNPTVRNLTD